MLETTLKHARAARDVSETNPLALLAAADFGQSWRPSAVRPRVRATTFRRVRVPGDTWMLDQVVSHLAGR